MTMTANVHSLWFLTINMMNKKTVYFSSGSFAQAAYYGQPLGHLSSLHHGVSGEVFAVDTRTLHIRDFTYDGEGPAAYFYVGDTKTPSGPGGVRLNDEKGS